MPQNKNNAQEKFDECRYTKCAKETAIAKKLFDANTAFSNKIKKQINNGELTKEQGAKLVIDASMNLFKSKEIAERSKCYDTKCGAEQNRFRGMSVVKQNVSKLRDATKLIEISKKLDRCNLDKCKKEMHNVDMFNKCSADKCKVEFNAATSAFSCACHKIKDKTKKQQCEQIIASKYGKERVPKKECA